MRAWFVLPALSLLSGCVVIRDLGGPSVTGSGKTVKATRQVSEFKRVDMTGAVSADIRVGPACNVTIEGDDNIVPLIETAVEGNTLRIGSKGGFSTRSRLQVAIEMPECEGIKLSGSGRVMSSGFSGGSLDLLISGSGELAAEGKVDRLAARVSGSGVVDALELVAGEARADITGSGEVRVQTNGVLRASISGSGGISYRGEPKSLEKSITGSGTIKPL